MLIDLDLLDINYSILSRRIKLIDSNIGTVGIASSLTARKFRSTEYITN